MHINLEETVPLSFKQKIHLLGQCIQDSALLPLKCEIGFLTLDF